MGVTAAKIYDPNTRKIEEISVGKSFSVNNKIFILDSNLEKVRMGGGGEIYISGPGLAEGYLGMEKMTKEKFIWINDIEKQPIRVYRTGDLGSFLPNGDIAFLGRSDFQVKIYGHRVELGEVEKVICEYPRIKRAVVMLSEDNSECKELVAYYSTSEKEFTKTQLKLYLLKMLPSYMVPSRLIEIKKWPLTENGKVHRKALNPNEKS